MASLVPPEDGQPRAGAASWFISPMGQSGNPLSSWYDNTVRMWELGEYWRMSLYDYPVAAREELKPQ